jgi:hypothetical protein
MRKDKAAYAHQHLVLLRAGAAVQLVQQCIERDVITLLTNQDAERTTELRVVLLCQ